MLKRIFLIVFASECDCTLCRDKVSRYCGLRLDTLKVLCSELEKKNKKIIKKQVSTTFPPIDLMIQASQQQQKKSRILLQKQETEKYLVKSKEKLLNLFNHSLDKLKEKSRYNDGKGKSVFQCVCVFLFVLNAKGLATQWRKQSIGFQQRCRNYD